MTWGRARYLMRRLRPATIRTRLALLAAVVTLVPLSAGAVPIALMERTSLLQSAARRTSEAVPDATELLTTLVDPPDCTRSFQRAQRLGNKNVSLCTPTKQAGQSTGKLSLVPWTDPAGGPVPIRTLVNRSTVAVGLSPNNVVIAQSLEAEQARLNTVVRVLLGGVASITLLVAGTTWFAAGRVLRPVEAIRADFADLSARHLDRRVPVPRTGNEIARLAVTMNATLDQLQTAVDRQRRFTADASHELRTPLACLRTELELALNSPESADWPQVVGAAHDDTIRLQTLMENLLLLARLDAEHAEGRTWSGTPVDLTDLVREEIARRPASRVTLHAVTGSDPLLVPGRPALIARVLANLLDNAERHATSSVTVHLTHDTDRGEAVLDVEDDGPGIPAPDRARIFQRFTRLDDARARDTGGFGLGLAIAHDVALLHNGTLTLAPPDGTTRFTVRLPLDR
nr:HAMP domain-containing histidine kinase [Streptomyces sp. NBC_00886]